MSASAGTATWLTTPSSGDWNQPANWTAGGPPNSPLDAANFGNSSITNIALSANTEVATMNINGASAYTLTIPSSKNLTLSGGGVVNISGQLQTFNVLAAGVGFPGQILFKQSATAGNQTGYNLNGGNIAFIDTSSAGTAEFNLKNGSRLHFEGNATAATSKVTVKEEASLNFGGLSMAGQSLIVNQAGINPGSQPGQTLFGEEASAGRALITNQGSASGSVRVGLTEFSWLSNADQAEIRNLGGVGANGNGGLLRFIDSTAAGTAVLRNEGGTASNALGGTTQFLGTSNADESLILNLGGSAEDAGGGQTSFFEDSSAGTSTIENEAATVMFGAAGSTEFLDRSTAANSVITNSAGFDSHQPGGTTTFRDASNAGSAFISNFGGTVPYEEAGITNFFQQTSASTATILNSGGLEIGALSGKTRFNDQSTAGFSSITNIGASGAGFSGGETQFKISSSAGSSFIINESGIYDGAEGGQTLFADQSTAGESRILNNGTEVFGSRTTRSGATFFKNDSTADSALIENLSSTVENGEGGRTIFDDNSSAANSTIINRGSQAPGYGQGTTTFEGFSNAANANILVYGATEIGGLGGEVIFTDGSSAGNATITAYSGLEPGGGGTITFAISDGGTARIILQSQTLLNIQSALQTGSIEGNGVIDLGDGFFVGSLAVGTNGRSTLFYGEIRGAGSFTKLGSGTLNLTGANTYTGNTDVLGGTLLVNGSLASGQTTVHTGATLGGSGFILGNVTNSGVVSPGNSPGKLRIGGNYTQTNRGALIIEIASRNSYDQLIIGGKAKLGGKLQLVVPRKLQLRRGDRFPIIKADAGVSGKFSRVINPLPKAPGHLLYLDVQYTPKAVVVATTQNSFQHALSLFSLTRNQTTTAAALDSALFDPRQDKVLDHLDYLNIADVPAQLDRIAPEELAALYTIGFSQIESQTLSVSQRLAEIRAQRNFTPSPTPAISPGKGIAAGKSPSPLLPEGNTAGFFLTQSGDITNQSSSPNAEGYDVESSVTMLGMDYRLGERGIIGLGLGYAHTNTDLNEGGEVTVDGGRVSLYGMVHARNGLFAEATVGGGFNSFEIERTGLEGIARGTTEGAQFDASTTLGFDAEFHHFTLTPSISVQYANVGFDDYEETGSLQPLHVQSQSEASFRSRIGLRAAYTAKLGNATLTPYVGAHWQHEFLYDELAVESRFANGAGDAFTVYGPRNGQDSALITGGINFTWSDYAVYLAYQADIGRENYEQQTFLLGFRMTW